MAHKKGQGSSRNGRDSQGQRFGVNALVASWFWQEISWLARWALNGIPEQCRVGKDFTLFAKLMEK